MTNLTTLALKRTILLISFFTLFSKLGFAQGGFEKAKIFLLSGDSLSVLISYKGLDNIYNKVYYRESDSGPDQALSAAQVKSIELSSGDAYHSLVVTYDSDQQNLRELPSSKEPAELKTDTVFLKILVAGTITLYQAEASGRQHFFIKKNNSVEELLFRRYTPEPQKVLENNRFVEQLWLHTKDCPSVQNSISASMSYNQSSIEKIIKKYNSCKGDAPIKKSERRSIAHVGVMSEFLGEQRTYTGGFKTDREWSPTIGVSLELRSTKEYKILSFYSEVKYSYFKGETYLPNYPEDIYVGFDLKYFQMVNLLRWTIYKNETRIFFNTGIKTSFLIEGEMIYDESFSNYVNREIGVSSWDSGLVLGAGLYLIDREKIKITSELRLSVGVASIASTSGTNMTNNCVGITLNFSPRF